MASNIAFTLQLETPGTETAAMRIASWNSRGLGDKVKDTLVFDIISKSKADFVCIQETKLQDITKFKAAMFLPSSYTGLAFQPSEGASAGTLIAWNEKNHTARVVEQNRNSMTVAASSTQDNHMYTITNVYAPVEIGRSHV